nr:MAG TPA: hypothetical protein [Caudoviricetes sp.]
MQLLHLCGRRSSIGDAEVKQTRTTQRTHRIR